MPGVPSSRGCDACRRQNATSSNLPARDAPDSKSPAWDPASAASNSKRASRANPNPKAPARADFIEVLEVTDIRYDVTWYGPFLETLPRRIGSSPALDAAIGAVTSAVKGLRTGRNSPDAMTRYVKGWKALRTCLSDPEQTKSIHTVCAIYLMMICQSWVGRPDDHFANHGEILAQILNAALAQAGRGQFEDNMIVTLSMPVVLQSIVDPSIPVGPWFWAIAKSYEPKRPVLSNQGGPIPSLQFFVMAQITQWLRDPALHLVEIHAAYNQLIADCVTMRAVLDKIAELDAGGDTVAQPSTRLYTRPQAAYSMLLCLALVLNIVTRIFDPNSISLADEAADLISETIWLAHAADRYRPFGVSFMPVSLVMAWTATGDAVVKAVVEDILVGYEVDFPAVKWVQTCYWMQGKYDEIRRSQLEALFGTSC
ncbi:hypothetical protein BDW62DRAFT_196788 [Aspergillus aurantiobrunneus]